MNFCCSVSLLWKGQHPARMIADAAIRNTDVDLIFAGIELPAAERLKRDHASNRFAFVHQAKGVVDFFERHDMRDQIVDVDPAIHVPIDYFRNVAPPTCAAKSGTFPGAPGDELERAG